MDISGELLQNFRVSEQEASFKVEIKLSRYPNYFEEYKPTVPYQKLLDGYELYLEDEKPDKTGFISTNSKFLEDNTERSIRRTRKQITDYILCNDFDLFGTFTFKEDRYDVAKCKRKMSTWLTNQKKAHGSFRHLIVPEFHKDKEALHFHILMGGYTGNLMLARNYHTGEPLKIKGRQQYNFGEYKSGLNSAEFITSKKKAGSYLRKYITKDMPLFPGKKRYWSSRGLLLPEALYNPSDQSYRDLEIIDVYWNDLGTKVRYAIPEGYQNG